MESVSFVMFGNKDDIEVGLNLFLMNSNDKMQFLMMIHLYLASKIIYYNKEIRII